MSLILISLGSLGFLTVAGGIAFAFIDEMRERKEK